MCVPESFCLEENSIEWEIIDSDITLNNIITKFDLTCASPFFISQFGMAVFIGFTFGSFFLPKLSDDNGRKRYFLIEYFI